MADDLRIVLNGVSFEGWKSFALLRGVQQIPSILQVTYADAYPDSLRLQMNYGQTIEAYLGDDKVFTGYITTLSATVAKDEHTISIECKGMSFPALGCIDLRTIPNSQLFISDIVSMTKQLVTPLGKGGIVVKSDTTQPMLSAPSVALNYGETSWSVIDRVAKYTGVVVMEDVDGALLITDVGKNKMASGIIDGSYKSGSGRRSIDDRASEYFVTWSNTDYARGYDAASPIAGSAQDPELLQMGFNTPLFMVGDPAMWSQPIAQKQAIWIAANRYGQGHVLTVTLNSWRDTAGKLWKPNWLVDINCPALKFGQETLVIASVEYSKDKQNGTLCTLTMIPPGGLAPEPISLISGAAAYELYQNGTDLTGSGVANIG